MITLFFLVCLSAHPDVDCHKMSVASFHDDLSCRMRRNRAASEWQEAHPDKVLVRAWCGEK